VEYKDEFCASGGGVLGSVSKALHSEWLFRSHSHCFTFTLRNKIYSRPKGWTIRKLMGGGGSGGRAK